MKLFVFAKTALGLTIAAAKAALFPSLICTFFPWMFAAVAGEGSPDGRVVLSFLLCCFVPFVLALRLLGRRFAAASLCEDQDEIFRSGLNFGLVVFVTAMIAFLILKPWHGQPHYFWLVVALFPLMPWLGGEALDDFGDAVIAWGEAGP